MIDWTGDTDMKKKKKKKKLHTICIVFSLKLLWMT